MAIPYRSVAPPIYRRTTCRLCEHTDLELVLQLRASPPVDAYVGADRLSEAQPLFPLDVFLCRACGHVQLLDVVNPALLFSSYIYVTSSSPGLVDHFRRYADAVMASVRPASGALAVDIGSNDGTLLGFLRDRGMQALGVDPAQAIARRATAEGIETWPQFFTAAVGRQIRDERGPAALVTANNVFAHADDLADMADGVRTLLAPDGVFVFEVSYLLDMVEGMLFDFIYHEHLCYHAAKPLVQFLARHGMELIDVQRNPVKGGSLRGFAQRAGGPRRRSPAVDELLAVEDRVGLDRPELFRQYAARIDAVTAEITALLRSLRAQGKHLAGYGASATTTVLTYQFGLGEVLEFLVDDNRDRQQLYSPGYHLPVLGPESIYRRRPDFLLLLAWRYAGMIIAKHQSYRAQGGRFIIPLPTLEIR